MCQVKQPGMETEKHKTHNCRKKHFHFHLSRSLCHWGAILCYLLTTIARDPRSTAFCVLFMTAHTAFRRKL